MIRSCFLSETHPNSILVETRHGGHLGFFESGILTPDPITWLDRSALQYAEAIVTLFVANSLPHLKLKAAWNKNGDIVFFSAQLQHLASIQRAPVVMCLNFQLIQFSSSYKLFKNVDWKALTICLIKKWKPFETKVVNVI